MNGDRIIPSKPNIWVGTLQANSPFTLEQSRAIEGRSIAVDTIWVRRLQEPPTLRMPPQEINIPCPVLARAQGRVLIVTPGGFKKWVSEEKRCG